jgi:type IV pilus assembly protein PilO
MKTWPWYYYVLIVVLALGIFYLAYYKPKNSELQTIKDERIKTEREVLQLRAKKKQSDQLQKELETMDSTLKVMESIIPKKREIGDILRRTQQLAYDSNLNIVRFQPKGEVNKEFYSDWPIQIEINGSFHNLGRFFARLGNFSRLFTIEEFTIRTLPNQSDASTISADCIAQTYILREPKAKPPAKKKPKRGQSR